ncbi:CCDC90 family protein [Sphingomonas sp. RRHST34]|uniref:CCDC90 family protein n=1 Tax=Sphingomonas citri TaxID=2862499 RepID=A0ABS7BTB4_9SPHN|nr:CCDC90 family protein [Sphingomonas citri]MBW6532816.1 CCDC90 family protein [Sphingomonas citri]
MGIDTLSIAKDLRAAALPQDQAEAIAAAIGRATSEGAATKSDLDRLGERIDARFEQEAARIDARFDRKAARVDARFVQVDARFDQIEARLEEADVKVDARFAQFATDLRLVEERMSARIEAAKTQLLTWLVGAIFTATGVLIAVLKL